MTLPGTLIIARHHESLFNKSGLWTGTRDVPLSELGIEKSGEMGALIKDIPIDRAFCSTQMRSLQTLEFMLEAMRQTVPIARSAELNERDYGVYTGKNKWEMKEAVGEEAFDHMRRDWDYPIPNGETLKMVYERVIPFYKEAVLPLLASGDTVLIVSHGNALRALTIYLESIPPEKAHEVEMLFGAAVLYRVDDGGRMISKEARTIPSDVNA